MRHTSLDNNLESTPRTFHIIFQKVKLIFHQKVNRLALGARIGHDPQYVHFMLPIPCWYLESLKDNASYCGPNANPNQPNVSTNVSRWNMVGLGNILVRFALGMSILYCLFPSSPRCSEIQTQFLMEYGLKRRQNQS